MFTLMNYLADRVFHRKEPQEHLRVHAPLNRRVINREPSPVAATSRIELPDGSWLPASQHELARYIRTEADLATPSLNALDRRSPSYLDIVSFLIDTGRTPASMMDIQEAFVATHQRVPGPIELETMRDQVDAFGMLAE
ncbi:hypothetical protein [uncultured Corynebacterium sp.]|uniref:hypothetical protein n=1 Tax=uncultured Corynebacterium sp. TaxID=159447 RepID=UPI002598563F|nr:hypothetical protein [uncultured Corynebacterium sp.]